MPTVCVLHTYCRWNTPLQYSVCSRQPAEDQDIEVGQWAGDTLGPGTLVSWQRRQDTMRAHFLGADTVDSVDR